MMGSKKTNKDQQYEDYWKLTLEYSDIYGKQFNTILNLIVKYIDKYSNMNDGLVSDKYNNLQKDIEKIYPKEDSASTRKSINQMFKLGFINNKGKSYHSLTKKFLCEIDKEQKKILFSQIVYSNASFSRSYTNESNDNEMNFLLKTLEECGRLSKKEILALMFCKIKDYPKGYLTETELREKVSETIIDNIQERKYNQVNYLFSLCSNYLTGIFSNGKEISLNEDEFLDKDEKIKSGRDPYLQRLFKINLINEVKNIYKYDCGKCVLEDRSYPVLIASHIKPYKNCDGLEQFDKDNGLLLSKNMDSLFDLGYMTFDDTGNIIFSKKLRKDVTDYVKQFHLDLKIYNKKRQDYMKYHRKFVFIDNKELNDCFK